MFFFLGGDPNKMAVPLWFLMFLPLLWVWSDSTEKGGTTSSLCSKEPGGDPFYQVFELWLLLSSKIGAFGLPRIGLGGLGGGSRQSSFCTCPGCQTAQHVYRGGPFAVEMGRVETNLSSSHASPTGLPMLFFTFSKWENARIVHDFTAPHYFEKQLA